MFYQMVLVKSTTIAICIPVKWHQRSRGLSIYMAACLKLQLQMEVTSGRLGILNVLGVFTGPMEA